VSAPSPLPVLDISGFRSDPDGPAGKAFVEALRDAFHGIGAAYLIGHGVPDELVTRVRRVAEEFFERGLECVGECDASGARIDDNGVAGFHECRGALANAALLFQVRRALGFVRGFRHRPAHHLAIDGAAIGACHDATFGEETKVLADGLHAHTETFGQ